MALLQRRHSKPSHSDLVVLVWLSVRRDTERMAGKYIYKKEDGHCLKVFVQTILKMPSLKDILNVILNVSKLSYCSMLRLSFHAFCLIPGAQNH